MLSLLNVRRVAAAAAIAGCLASAGCTRSKSW